MTARRLYSAPEAWGWCSRAAINSFSILACSAGSIAA
jgi:hypothetical protein